MKFSYELEGATMVVHVGTVTTKIQFSQEQYGAFTSAREAARSRKANAKVKK